MNNNASGQKANRKNINQNAGNVQQSMISNFVKNKMIAPLKTTRNAKEYSTRGV